MTTRLTPKERALFRSWQGVGGCTEPALGTLEQRLTIVIHRLGGRTAALPRLSAEERELYAGFKEGVPPWTEGVVGHRAKRRKGSQR